MITTRGGGVDEMNTAKPLVHKVLARIEEKL